MNPFQLTFIFTSTIHPRVASQQLNNMLASHARAPGSSPGSRMWVRMHQLGHYQGGQHERSGEKEGVLREQHDSCRRDWQARFVVVVVQSFRPNLRTIRPAYGSYGLSS